MHTHISGLTAVITSLSVVLVLGTGRLWAATHPDSTLAQAYLLLY